VQHPLRRLLRDTLPWPVDDVLTWRPLLSGGQADAAVAVATDVAMRLREPERVRAALSSGTKQTAYPLSVRWTPYSVAQGDAGLAILSGYLDLISPADGWDAVAHEQLARAARDAAGMALIPTGLFEGLSGVGLVAHLLSRSGTRYGRFLVSIDETLIPRTLETCDRLTAGDGLSPGGYDLISGLTGVAAYLLCRLPQPGPRAALEAILRYLIWLAGEDQGLPRWYTPPEHMLPETRAYYPSGNLNCGLAHGIPGPLAVTALAHDRGIGVEGSESAMRRWADWLITNRADDAWGPNWPDAFPPPDHGPENGSRSAVKPTHAAWCYGSPGVARSLWLAGVALGHVRYQEFAIEVIAALCARPAEQRRLGSRMFCHGVSGLLQIIARFAHDTGRPDFRATATSLAVQILDGYDPDSILGYRRWEPGGGLVDHPGLLDGAPGVALALAAAACPDEPTWDRLFLLS
jgi:lantibiotic biosynthesis protein